MQRANIGVTNTDLCFIESLVFHQPLSLSSILGRNRLQYIPLRCTEFHIQLLLRFTPLGNSATRGLL